MKHHLPNVPVLPETNESIPLMGPSEVAKMLGVSSAWVRDHATRKTPKLPSIKVGRLLRFRSADVHEFIRRTRRFEVL